MEEDRDAESQTSSSHSSSWWMMKNLWRKGASDERRFQASIADTCLLEDGHPLYWYFTSSKSGRILKRDSKRCEWGELLSFIRRRARATWRDGGDRWMQDVAAIARRSRGGTTKPIMLTLSDIECLLEKHNANLLDEIIAIQPHMIRKPFVGCGLFETTFIRKGHWRDAQIVCVTYELAKWIEDHEGREGFDDSTDRSGSHPGKESGNCSPIRVHGVIHRVLATTTRAVVAHVEQETGEIILKVIAQHIFHVGNGQPTLLWLDSVVILRSSGCDIVTESNGEEDIAIDGFTHALRDAEHEWTTYFPPKPSELGRGGAAGGDERMQSTQPLSLKIRDSKDTLRFRDARQAILHNAIELTAGRTINPLSLCNNSVNTDAQESSTSLASDELVKPSESMGKDILRRGRGRFALHTESWANRLPSSREFHFDSRRYTTRQARGLRKRSMVTVTRTAGLHTELPGDCESTVRPSTAPARAVGVREWSLGDDRCLRSSTTSSELGSKAKGCYGDYCRCVSFEPPSGEERGMEGSSWSDGGFPSSMVPNKSILKCRAEEKALSALALNRVLSGYSRPANNMLIGMNNGASRGSRYQEEHLATEVAERMRILALSLNDDGIAEYARLRYSDRKRVGAPEPVERAVEALLYEEVLCHIHPTTVCRPVPVCNSCTMVYGYMDLYRNKAKRLKQLSREQTRVALRVRHREQVAIRRKSIGGNPSQSPMARLPEQLPLRRLSAVELDIGADS